MEKFYLQIEIRYSIPIDESAPYPELQRTHFNKFLHSELFDTQKECIDYGNKTIEANTWIEQYPGHADSRLNSKFGEPLVAPSLKNGAQIFISVKKMNVLHFTDIDIELQKFNVDKILKKI